MRRAAHSASLAAPRLPARYSGRVLAAANRLLRGPAMLPDDAHRATLAIGDAWALYGVIMDVDRALSSYDRRIAGDLWTATVRAANQARWERAGVPVLGRVGSDWVTWVVGMLGALVVMKRRRYGKA
jgi:hypothetical protein